MNLLIEKPLFLISENPVQKSVEPKDIKVRKLGEVKKRKGDKEKRRGFVCYTGLNNRAVIPDLIRDPCFFPNPFFLDNVEFTNTPTKQ